MKRAKKHRKRHVLPGPAGLLQQRSKALENGIKVPSPNQRNEQTLVHDEEVRSKKQKSNLSHAQIWDAMCLSMNRIVPACSNLGILRRALSPEYSLLAEVANAQNLKIKKLVVQIEAIHSHGHSDYTVDLSDESTRMLSTTIPRHGGAEYSSSVPIGWLSQSLIQMHPEWIKLGTVMLCHDVTVAVFRSNKGLIDRMILLGDENVVYAWTDDSVHMTTLGEQGKFSEDEKYLRLLERRAEVEERLRGSIPPDYVSENGSSCCESEEEEDVEILDPDRNDILVVGAASNEGSEWLEISEPVQMGIQQNQKQHLNRMDNIIQSSLKEKENDANQESQSEVPSHTVQQETLQTSLTNMNSTSAHSRNVRSNTPSNQVQIDDAMTDAMKNIDRRDLIPEHASSINLRSSGTIQTTHQRKVVNPYSKAKGVLPSRLLDTVETDISVRSLNGTYSMNQTHIVNPYARKAIPSTPIPQPSTSTEREQVTREISTTSRVEENHSRQTNRTSNASSNPANMSEKIGTISSDSYHRDNDHEHISEQTQRKIHGSNWDLIAQEIDDKDAFDENIVDQSHDVSSESQRTTANDQILASQNTMGRNTEASYIFNGIDKIEDCELDAFSEYD